MEILNHNKQNTDAITTAIFDFDGTISTLRANWEGIMREFMLETICPLAPNEHYPEALEKEIDEYISESTGIQTGYQMQWLRERVESYGKATNSEDIWVYKDEYNRRLLIMVRERIKQIQEGLLDAEDFRIAGSLNFCKALYERGVKIYIASGTDHGDLTNEIEVLGIAPYVTEAKGAPTHRLDCSKEDVFNRLLADIRAEQLVVFGDGKVEIRLGHDVGARAIATATDEKERHGVDPIKRDRLIQAGADVIVGDFLEQDELLNFLNLN